MKKSLFLLLLSSSLFAQINPDNIKIARDKWGVPHIFAKTDPEVSYGLAWANAEDDFPTMQLTMLSGKSMLAQVKGKSGASIDYVVNLLRCREIVEEQYETLSPDFKQLIEGYVAGINAYAASHPKEIMLKGSFPTTTKEYLTSVVLSTSVISGVDGVLGNIFKGKVKTLESFKIGGSNAFAIHSSKTTDGKTYLDINSHQPFEGPAAWYEAHLCSEQGWNMLGGLFPGGPVVFHGTNEHLGWAHTVNYQDKIDVYQLEINPQNKLQYRFDNEWINLEEKTVKLKVKLGFLVIPIKKKAYWSKYGATLLTPKGTFSVRLGANQDIRAIEQWYRMNKASNFTEFYKAMQMTAIPGFNTIYADQNDTIFYVSNGKIPIREKGFDWKGTLPGNTSKTLWTKFHPVEDLPQYLNPKGGYLFNTNHTPFNGAAPDDNLKADKFDPTMGYETLDNNRSKRFMELIAPLNKVSYEDFKRIKYDNQLPQTLAYPLNLDELFGLNSTEYPDIKTLIEQLQAWDHKTNADSKGAAVFLMCLHHFIDMFDKSGKDYNYKLTKEECVATLRAVKESMTKNFGRTDITLGDYQVHTRGEKEIPSWGIPDVLTAMHAKPYKNGKVRTYAGESYIELVKYSKNALPEIESVICYGASSRPKSPHYTDQMGMFIRKETKKMTLDKTQVLKEAIRVYAPK